MTEIDRLIANAESHAESFRGGLPAPPARKLAVLTCMDARIDVHALLGLEEGEAHVLRNSGGVATEDARRSLAISQNMLGTEEIVLIHHTDCGIHNFSDREIADRIEERTGVRPSWESLAFDDLEQDVRDSMEAIRNDPLIPSTDRVRGFVFDVKTGELREVR